jgi:hypothetical protein
MNAYLLSYFALDLARERTLEAEARWRERILAQGKPEQGPRVRRFAARMLAAVSLGSASVARKLDACVADDLGRSLAPAE